MLNVRALPVAITNCSNNYGPYQFPEKVIPLFVTHALDELQLPLYASMQNRREWLHVVSHCRAIELVLEWARGRTYNVGSGLEVSVEELADQDPRTHRQEQRAEVDRPGPTRSRPALPPRLDEAPASSAGSRPGTSVGLADTVRWYGAHREVVGAAPRAMRP